MLVKSSNVHEVSICNWINSSGFSDMFPNLPILPEFFQVLPILLKFGLQLITSSKQHPKCNPSSLSVGTIESAQGQEVEGCDDQTWGQWDNHRQTRYK